MGVCSHQSIQIHWDIVEVLKNKQHHYLNHKEKSSIYIWNGLMKYDIKHFYKLIYYSNDLSATAQFPLATGSPGAQSAIRGEIISPFNWYQLFPYLWIPTHNLCVTTDAYYLLKMDHIVCILKIYTWWDYQFDKFLSNITLLAIWYLNDNQLIWDIWGHYGLKVPRNLKLEFRCG